MMRVPIPCRLLLAALILTGCAGQPRNAPRERRAYVVFFAATRSADHTALVSASVPVNPGGEERVKISSKSPSEGQPALPEFVVRLNRTKQAGVYELMTRAAVRESARNKKGRLKTNKRYVGALVPTRLGETQVVSAEGDPIHLEARLERR